MNRKGTSTAGRKSKIKNQKSKVLWNGLFSNFKWLLYLRRGVLVPQGVIQNSCIQTGIQRWDVANYRSILAIKSKALCDTILNELVMLSSQFCHSSVNITCDAKALG